jgi:hypothetical protein
MAGNQKGANQILWIVLLGAASFAGGLVVLYILFILLGSLGFLGI